MNRTALKLETARLYLRAFEAKDAEGFFEMNADAEVMQYTGDRPFEHVEAARSFIADYKHYEEYGLGRLTIIEKESGAYLGFCGLKYSPEKQEVDIGFRIKRDHWNKGFATESAGAVLTFGFEQRGLQRIVGRAMKANRASIRVLEKLGMQKILEFQEEENDWCLFELLAKKTIHK